MQYPPIPRLVLYALGVTLALALVIAASTSAVAFGTYNVEWDGTADFRALADEVTDSTVALETEPYETIEPNGTLAVVLAPAQPYDANDSDRVRSFVEAGGTLLVADNFGPTEATAPYGNALLADVGADARFDGDPLRDEREYYRSPALPVATTVTPHPYTTGVEDLTLNHGTAVEPNGADVVVATSEFAYLDRDRSGELDDDEELASYPIVTIESVGEGAVVTLGDPSVFINVMLERPGNAAFASALFAEHERTLLDYSYSGNQPPLAVALLVLRESVAMQVLLGVVGVGVGWSVISNPGRGRARIGRLLARLPDPVATRIGVGGDDPSVSRRVAGEEELTAYLRRRHPDWDEQRIRRVIAGVIHEETPRSDDE